MPVLQDPAIPQEIGASVDNQTSLTKIPLVPGDKVEKPTNEEIVVALESYRTEAEYARLAGPNSRDLTWLQNLDLYWNRFDFSGKAAWQAREVLPEFPLYVDRFAAALRTALMSSEEFFSVQIDNDEEGDIAKVITKAMHVILRRIGRSSSGHRVDFSIAFEESMKYAALMMAATVVSAKKIDGVMQVVIENVDPYNVWLDPTGRGLYRLRRVEMDLNEFQSLAKKRDGQGKPLYDVEELQLAGSTQGTLDGIQRAEREKRTGTGQSQMMSNRKPVVVYEFYGTLLDSLGNTLGEGVLATWANHSLLIRGPEENPFWHGKDWLVTAPILPVPGAPYGRAYVENFASIAKSLNELTNLILDAIFTSAMKAFAVVPSMLEDPSQIEEGVYPNVVFRLNDGGVPADFVKEVNLGQLPPEVMQFWGALKKELQEGAAFSDLSLGQPAAHSRTSATEIGTAEQNSNSLIRSIASNVECGFLEPLLETIWKTAIQHLDPKDDELKTAIGEQWFDALRRSKKQFAKYRTTFVVRGISSMIEKAQKLQKLMQLIQVVGGNPQLAQQFMQEVSVQKLINYIFELFDVDTDRILMSDREKQAAQVQQAQQQKQQAAQQMIQQVLGAVKGGAQRGAPQGPPQGPQRGSPAGLHPPAGPAGGQAAPPQGGPPAQAQVQLPIGAGGVAG